MDRIKLIHTDTLSCEPILRRVPNGELLCTCQCGDTYEPAPGNRMLAFHSRDNGETWTGGESISPETGEAVYATETMVLDGIVTIFCEFHSGRFLNMRCEMLESRDSGYTWQSAGSPPFFPSFCFIRSLLPLRSGELLIPYQAFPVSKEENTRLILESHNIQDARLQRGIWDIAGPAVLDTGVLLSRDGGKTYTKHEGPQVTIKDGAGPGWTWTEPTVTELPDGRLVMLIRIDGSGRLWRSDSMDGGRSWSALSDTGIPSPGCKVKLIGLPDGRAALIHTPNPAGRFPLSLWISDDGLETWKDRRVLTDFPGTYHYPDGFYEDGHILLSIEHNRQDILFFDIEV